MINENISVQQGWQCPICHRVYSPRIPMCYYCGGEQKTITYTTSTEGEQKTITYATSTENVETAKMNSHAPIHPQQQIGG